MLIVNIDILDLSELYNYRLIKDILKHQILFGNLIIF